MCDACVLREGADAAGDLLDDVFRIPVAKALNPLNQVSFVAIIRRVAMALRDAAGTIEAEAADMAIKLVDVDWEKLSWKQRAARFTQIDQLLAQAGDKELPGIKTTLETHSDAIVGGTRKRLVQKYDLGIQATMTARDSRTAATLVDHNCLFVRNRYGDVATRLSAKAREIVATGLEQGLGRDDIAGDLVKVMRGARRPDSYWNLIAGVFSNRARTFTQIHTFDEAGIRAYALSAVMDEVTTDFCRFIDGKEFPVEKAVDRIQRIERAEDPEPIVDVLPWARVGKDKDGRQVLYYKKGERNYRICVVEESGVGYRDKIGTYTHALAPEALARGGMTMPPFHGHCRTTVIPVF